MWYDIMKTVERGKLFSLIASILIVSAAISFAITFTFNEIKEKGEELLIKIDTDRAPIGIEPLILNVSASVLNSNGKIKYKWDFGNGETSNEEKVTITYDEPGIYNCTLLAMDETGRKAKDSIKIIVERNRPPIVTLNINRKTIDRNFTWLGILAVLPIPLNPYQWAGNQQLALDRIEAKKGPWAWGDSGVVITAQISDPEGDEIVSYEWREQLADKVVTMTGKTFLPVHNLTGNESVKIPALYAWMPNRHIVTLTVKDSAGNIANATVDYMVSPSQRETRIASLKTMILFLPSIMSIVGGAGSSLWNQVPEGVKEGIFSRVDELYEEIKTNPSINSTLIGSLLLSVITKIPNMFGIPYEPPLDKAELKVSDIKPFNFSLHVNESGVVEGNVTVSRSLNITNIDTRNTAAFDIYLSLDKPYSDEKGLPPQLEKEGLTVELKFASLNRKLFYRANYSEWNKGIKIEEMHPGDQVELVLSLTLDKGLNLEKQEYQCYLYLYQGKTIHKDEFVDTIPFEVIV